MFIYKLFLSFIFYGLCYCLLCCVMLASIYEFCCLLSLNKTKGETKTTLRHGQGNKNQKIGKREERLYTE